MELRLRNSARVVHVDAFTVTYTVKHSRSAIAGGRRKIRSRLEALEGP